jgi:hypothetical protein
LRECEGSANKFGHVISGYWLIPPSAHRAQ